MQVAMGSQTSNFVIVLYLPLISVVGGGYSTYNIYNDIINSVVTVTVWFKNYAENYYKNNNYKWSSIPHTIIIIIIILQ